MRRPPVPGAEQAFSIDTLAEAVRFDACLARIAATASAPHIAIIGAGFTGIELALELADRLMGHGGNGKRLRISLFDRAAEVGPELGPGPRAEIEAALAAAAVELRLGMRVTGLAADRIDLADISISADAVVLCTGMEAAGFARHVPGERDGLGRILVAADLRVPSAPAIFVAGDAAAADTGDGHLALQSCQHALQLGRFAGENAARDLMGQPTIPYMQPRYVTCLDLGRSGAVLTQGWDRQVRLRGAAAKAVKQRINRQIIYPPSDVPGELLLTLSSTDPAQQGEP
jgi:NADH dehydrogenase